MQVCLFFVNGTSCIQHFTINAKSAGYHFIMWVNNYSFIFVTTGVPIYRTNIFLVFVNSPVCIL
jgi:hypothetical protein